MALKQEERAGEEEGLPEPEDQDDPDEPAILQADNGPPLRSEDQGDGEPVNMPADNGPPPRTHPLPGVMLDPDVGARLRFPKRLSFPPAPPSTIIG